MKQNDKVIENIKQLNNSRKIFIATGRSRKETKWKNIEITYESLIDKLQTTTRTRETFNEYKKMSKTQRDEIKDVGGFVGGSLKDGRRKAENIANRSLLTLDMDTVDMSINDLWDSITMFNDYEILMYSTHSHEPKSPRLRLVIPLDRTVLPDEYQAIGRKIAEEIGIDMFDDTTYEPSRLMYWPSTSSDGEYIFKRQVGHWLSPDLVLAKYLDWRDVSFWPESSRQSVRIHSQIKKQEDPLEKRGIIGAFCRTYSISEVIDKFLNEVYIPTNVEGRYTYSEGSTVGGLVVYEDKFAYSHHGTDPTSGILCNAFDLVRIHKFGIRDEEAKEGTPVNRMPSFTAMSEFASSDDNVKLTLGSERLNEAMDDFDLEGIEDVEIDTEWLKSLDYDNKGNLRNTIDNAVIILENDPRIKGKLIYNEFSNRATVVGKLPWSNKEDGDWSDNDDAGIRYFMESNYNLTGAGKIDDAVTILYEKHKFHPVRDYLNSLEWDGKERIETLLTDYLGAKDYFYTRAVIRTHLVAAVARVFDPGCKYDTMLTLIGPQGKGKSTFVKNLGKDWFSDSLDTVKGKEAYELLQGAWLIEMGELTATRKADIEAVKLFLSKTEDIYRVAYGRRTSRFPRQCIFWGTTNDKEFLRDKTGDRRTWPVDCMILSPTKNVWEEMPKEVDQIWAEAVKLYKEGHILRLEGEAADEAKRQQKIHAEDSPKTGLLEEYLDRDYPINWDEMDLYERRTYLDNPDDDFDTKASAHTMKKDKTCVMEIWCELFKGDPKSLTPILSREINDILSTLDGWERSKSNLSFGKNYGKQRAFIRKQI
ncbi:virulence-associated E family protein [Tissierella sp.]|uniref:virulence-associated E family protein n=1 Tax=Tissierella sp. TaxID=41274 RepID=UPI0028A93478|nr:virulence-associated E family protein [Tissierella sp.]